jgi:hypothetical protein
MLTGPNVMSAIRLSLVSDVSAVSAISAVSANSALVRPYFNLGQICWHFCVKTLPTAPGWLVVASVLATRGLIIWSLLS